MHYYKKKLSKDSNAYMKKLGKHSFILKSQNIPKIPFFFFSNSCTQKEKA